MSLCFRVSSKIDNLDPDLHPEPFFSIPQEGNLMYLRVWRKPPFPDVTFSLCVYTLPAPGVPLWGGPLSEDH